MTRRRQLALCFTEERGSKSRVELADSGLRNGCQGRHDEQTESGSSTSDASFRVVVESLLRALVFGECAETPSPSLEPLSIHKVGKKPVSHAHAKAALYEVVTATRSEARLHSQTTKWCSLRKDDGGALGSQLELVGSVRLKSRKRGAPPSWYGPTTASQPQCSRRYDLHGGFARQSRAARGVMIGSAER